MAPQRTILLTGATGFLGSAILAEAVRRGERIIALVRPESDLGRIRQLTGYERVTFQGLSDPALAEALRGYGCTTLIHCAWQGVAGKERHTGYQITENLPLTIDSVQLAARLGCRQWIGLGSQAEYGNPNRQVDETAPTHPTTMYGKAKLAAGCAALALCEASGVVGAWVRVFSTYGPGDAPHWMIPYVIRELLQGRAPRLTPCGQMWDYLYVLDAARAFLSLADGQSAGIFNLGSGQAVPLRQIVQLICSEINPAIVPAYGAVAYRPDQVMHLQADITRLKATTGWQPEVELAQGVHKTVAWERQQLAAQQLSPE